MNIQTNITPSTARRAQASRPESSDVTLGNDDHAPQDTYNGQHLGKLVLGGAALAGVGTALLDGTARDVIAGAGGVVGGLGAGFVTFGVTTLALGGKDASAGDAIVGGVCGLAVGGALAYAGLAGGPILKTIAGACAGAAAGLAINAALLPSQK